MKLKDKANMVAEEIGAWLLIGAGVVFVVDVARQFIRAIIGEP